MTVNAIADASLVIKGTQDTAYGSVGTNALSNTELKPSTSFDGVSFGKLASAVKVLSAADEAATWTGSAGAFQATDLVTVDSAGTFYATTEYSIKSISEAATVYVKSITLTGTDDNIDDAIRISVKIGSGATYVYNAGGGTNSAEGVGKLTGTTWSLASKTYDSVDDTDKTWSLVADTNTVVTVNIWYEGQDTNCFTDNISANDKAITIEFAKVS